MKSDEDNGILISTDNARNTSLKARHLKKPSKINSLSNEIDDDVHNDDEEEAFIVRDGQESGNENEGWKFKMMQRKWWFWAEIVLFMYSFSDFPNNFVTQKYTLDQITLYNWKYDLDHNITHNFDIFNSSLSANSCAVNSSSDAFQFSERNQMMTSHFSMIRMCVWIIPAMISNTIFGSMSDTFGRRWVFIPPLLGSFSWSFILCLITFYKANIYFILIIDLLNGIGGAFGCIILATVAYVAGQTNSEKRLIRLTILQVFSLIAASISPPIVGQLLDYLGAPITLLINSFISAFNLIYCITFLPNLPEPKIPANQPSEVGFDEDDHGNRVYNDNDRLIDIYNSVDDGELTTTNPCSVISEQFRNTIDLYTRNRKWVLKGRQLEIVKPEEYAPTSVQYIGTHLLPNNAVRLRILMIGFFIVCVPLFDSTIILNLYLLNSPLCWSSSMIGLFQGLSTLVCAIGSVSLTKILELWLDHVSITILCCVVCAVSRIYIIFVKNTFMMFLGIIFLPLTNIAIPSIRTIMTLLVPESKHGSVLGSLGSIEVLCCYTAAIIFNEVYAATLYISTAFVFVVSGCILLFGLFIFVIYKVKFKNNQALYFTDSMVIPVQH